MIQRQRSCTSRIDSIAKLAHVRGAGAVGVPGGNVLGSAIDATGNFGDMPELNAMTRFADHGRGRRSSGRHRARHVERRPPRADPAGRRKLTCWCRSTRRRTARTPRPASR